MCKTSVETAAAIAAFKGPITRLPEGTARGLDETRTASYIVREFIATHGPLKVKPHNGGRNYKRQGMVPSNGRL